MESVSCRRLDGVYPNEAIAQTGELRTQRVRAKWRAVIRNIIDSRKRPFRWKRIDAIIEATEHDNTCADADQAPESDPTVVVDYDRREGLSVEEAVTWAHQAPCHVTLYLYDEGKGAKGEEHFVEVFNRF